MSIWQAAGVPVGAGSLWPYLANTGRAQATRNNVTCSRQIWMIALLLRILTFVTILGCHVFTVDIHVVGDGYSQG